MFTKAIVRTPGATFAEGLTTVDLGIPSYELAREQHERYCLALEQCGLALTRLEADERYPDSTFVEDTAIITEHGAILTRPGAASRAGEVEAIREVLAAFYPTLPSIVAPGTLDGGDICEAGSHVFIGLSERTNEAGAEQLADWLAQAGYTSSCIDIRGLNIPGLLHLKSGLSYLGDNRLVVVDALADEPALQSYELVRVAPEESYAANCVRINDRVLIAAGYPRFAAELHRLSYAILALEMSEFRKMDGGLTCLSLRF